MAIPVVNIVHDSVCSWCSVCLLKIQPNPVQEVVLEAALDYLMEEIGCEKFMNIRAREVMCEKLIKVLG